ncbi:MAG: hypothetical protein R2848_08910 [Thermomicrobiales bacterium]
MDESDLLPNFEPHRYLSAPWRMRYLRDGVSVSGCVFCSKLEADDDENNLVLWRGDSISRDDEPHPYSTGYIMLAPYAHIATPKRSEPEIMVELGATIAPCMRALRSVLSCQGFNTGMNTGAVAGSRRRGPHAPAYRPALGRGCVNFMPIIGNTTVMPEALSVTYGRIRAALLEQLGAAL